MFQLILHPLFGIYLPQLLAHEGNTLTLHAKVHKTPVFLRATYVSFLPTLCIISTTNMIVYVFDYTCSGEMSVFYEFALSSQ